MSKIVGFRPQQETQKLIEKFEDEVLIRYNNQQLLESEVFPDGDAFVRFAITQERALVGGTA